MLDSILATVVLRNFVNILRNFVISFCKKPKDTRIKTQGLVDDSIFATVLVASRMLMAIQDGILQLVILVEKVNPNPPLSMPKIAVEN